MRYSRRMLALTLVVAGCGGCSMLWGDGDESVSVFDLSPRTCLTTPKKIVQQLSDLNRVSCSDPHTLEVFALVDFTSDKTSDAYPGDSALEAFANGSCAARYADYVGVDYRDSTYYYTYLAPSPRSWDQRKDRTVTCLITTTGRMLNRSLQGARL